VLEHLGRVDLGNFTRDEIAGRAPKTELHLATSDGVDRHIGQPVPQAGGPGKGVPHFTYRTVEQAFEPEHGGLTLSAKSAV
jgi:hypothetical protein